MSVLREQIGLVAFNSDDPLATRERPGANNVDVVYVAGSGGVTKGDWVSYDRSVITGRGAYITAIQGPATANFPTAGVAMETAAAGADVVVRRRGMIVPADGVNVNVADAVAAGGRVRKSATAGRADAGTVGTDHLIGVAHADADASNICTWIEVTCF
jgi:hypothetical protein